MDNFSWGSQFDGINYNSSLSSGEATGSIKKSTLDLNAGLSARYTRNAGTLSSNNDVKLIFGYSINHLTRPDIGFFAPSVLLCRHTVFVNGTIGIYNTNISLKPVVLLYNQGKQMEITGGTLVSFSYGEQSKITGFKKGSFFSVGALYRYNDAIIPTAQIESGIFVFGMSYDVNISSLKISSRYRGGFEIHLKIVSLSDFLYKDKNENPGEEKGADDK